MGGVGAQPVPGFVDGDGSCGGEVLAEFAVAFQGGCYSGVVGGAQGDGDLPAGEPGGGCEVGEAQGRGEGVHFLAEDGRAPADTATGGADLADCGFHVEGEGQCGGVAFSCGPGPVDEFTVGGGRPGGVVGAVGGPPLGEPGARVWEGALQDLYHGDASGAAHGSQDPAPGGDAAFLFCRVEKDEGGCPYVPRQAARGRGDGSRVGVGAR